MSAQLSVSQSVDVAAGCVLQFRGGLVWSEGWWLWMEADGTKTATAVVVTTGESPAPR